jgi:hypothetical protein
MEVRLKPIEYRALVEERGRFLMIRRKDARGQEPGAA